MGEDISNQRPSVKSGRRQILSRVIVFVVFILFALLMFREVLGPDALLFSTDNNPGYLQQRRERLQEDWGFTGWRDAELMGVPDLLESLNSTFLFLHFTGARFVNNWINAIDLVLASICLAFLLILRRRSILAAIIAGLTAFWVGSNFTLTYAGHIGKFGVLLWAACFLLLVDIAARRRSLAYATLAGGAMGVMFLEQADVALFFALALGPYAMYAFAREHGWRWGSVIKFVLPIILIAGLFGFRGLWHGYQTKVKDVSSLSAEDPRAEWNFVTQWSWPPEESLDFIAPGFFGWRSGEPAGPYWGRMGRSAAWETRGQGFRNFKLENQYLGAIPIGFALFAVFAVLVSFISRKPENVLSADHGDYRRDIIFWSLVALVTLLLSFGKYFPLYRVLYQFPGFDSVRNPNKFLQVFQLALAILAGYGFDLIRTLRGAHTAEDVVEKSPGKSRHDRKHKARHEAAKQPDLPAPIPAWVKRFAVALFVIGVILAIWALVLMGGEQSRIARLATQGWGQYSSVIARNMITGLWHAVVMVFITGGAIWWLSSGKVANRMAREAVKTGLVLLVAFDAVYLARHYVKAIPASALDANEVVRIAKEDSPEKRIAMYRQDGFYNYWLTCLFPYHDIRTVNIAQAPRMSLDYKRFLGTVGRNRVRLWQLGAVAHVLMPADVWSKIEQEPALADAFKPVFSYDVFPAAVGVNVLPAVKGSGQHVVLRFLPPAPRFCLVSGWRKAQDEETLQKLASPDFKLFNRLLIAPETKTELPEPSGEGMVGTVELLDYYPGYMKLRSNSEQPAMLRVSERYDDYWQATVDGNSTQVYRADYLFPAVYVPAGIHEIVLKHTMDWLPWAMQFGGIFLCGLAFLAILPWPRLKKAKAGSDS